MKKLIFTLFLGLFLVNISIAGEIDPSLSSKMSNYGDDEFIPVLIFLNEQADVKQLDRDLHNMNATRKYRHEVVVRTLQDVANSTQDNLRAFLSEKAADDNVRDIRSFWIINAFSAEVKKEVIPEIADHIDVKKVYFDAPMELIEPVSKDGPLDDGGSRSVEPNLISIRADECWEMGINGEGVIVSSLDTGVDGDHPALVDRWRGNFAPPEECFYDAVNPGNHDPFDSGQHGTHTMGTITGLGEATGDTIGVAWGALWIAAACIDYSGHSGYIASFEWIADPDGDPETVEEVPDVCSNSWGTMQYSPCDELFWESIDNCEAAGVMVVFAVGNEGTSGPIRRPGDRASTYYDTYTVGATQKTEPFTIANFSTRGPTPCGEGDLSYKPEVAAPGVDIRSSVPGSGYEGGWNGTSMACPHVAGVLALMRQVNPNIESQEAKQILMDTAMDLGSPGEDNDYGWGFIDAYEAVMQTYETLSYFEGHVTDSETGEPLRETYVSVMEDEAAIAISDSSGYYQLYVQSGEYQLTSQRFGYYDFESDVSYEIGAPETLTVDIQMDALPAGALSGYVTDISGEPVENARLTPLQVPLDPVYTDATGFYTYDPIPGNFSYAIEAYSDNHDTQIKDVTIPAGEAADLDFVMYPIESFEDDNGDFYTDDDSEWEWGTPVSDGGPVQAFHGSMVWGTDLDDLYDESEVYYLYTPEYTLHPNNDLYQLKFYHWYEFTDGWDGGNVEMMIGDSDEWELLIPEGGYPDNSVVALLGEPGYTDVSGGAEDNLPLWDVAYFDLSPYVGETVTFRFHFGSTNSNDPGWFIDHVVVYGSEEVPSAVDETSHIIGTPSRFQLFPNYPNPFNPSTEISYNLPKRCDVQLAIYDLEGKLVKTLVKSEQDAGQYSQHWHGTDQNGTSMPSGVYVCKLVAAEFSQNIKLVLLK